MVRRHGNRIPLVQQLLGALHLLSDRRRAVASQCDSDRDFLPLCNTGLRQDVKQNLTAFDHIARLLSVMRV